MPGAVTLDEISSLSAQQEALEEKKGDLQTQLDELKDQKNSAVSRCNLLSKKINVLEDQIATTQSVVDEYAGQIKENQKTLKKAKQEEADYYDLFCQRVRNMEENGTTSYWQILFGASGFSDFLDRVSFVSSVMEYDDSVLTNLEEARESVAQATEELQEKKTAKEKALDDLEQQQTQVNKASKEAAKTLKEIKANQDVYAEEMSEIDALADELAGDIVSAKSDYAAEQKAAAEKAKAEQKAAEEAAAKKAAERKRLRKRQGKRRRRRNSSRRHLRIQAARKRIPLRRRPLRRRSLRRGINLTAPMRRTSPTPPAALPAARPLSTTPCSLSAVGTCGVAPISPQGWTAPDSSCVSMPTSATLCPTALRPWPTVERA